MDTREDRLLALTGLLAAGLIAVAVIFVLTWLSDVRRTPVPYPLQECAPPSSVIPLKTSS
ncbi:hypothetical protein J3D56_000846 [Erwinia persicina]|jgi:hypothetical protein|uniref:Uncharacterized protein n=2 Tax=Erwinia TaxID=551 RepID=A0ABV4E459_9GAMM|nr:MULTISPECIES: hypothetical protein [Erwinia]MCP1437410.1 hypothetical protein [Erwinia persicina]MDN4626325.1 hypothetical protein [Erwinia sp. PsM31]MDN8540780.1 hypothetical protein [Erwinia sp. BC051422]RRZ92772.1 hypothetical protein EGK14_08510 [Erwinia sp. 198]